MVGQVASNVVIDFQYSDWKMRQHTSLQEKILLPTGFS